MNTLEIKKSLKEITGCNVSLQQNSLLTQREDVCSLIVRDRFTFEVIITNTLAEVIYRKGDDNTLSKKVKKYLEGLGFTVLLLQKNRTRETAKLIS